MFKIKSYLKHLDTYLIDIVEMGFHTFDGHIFVGLCRLSFKNLRKRSFSLLANQTILYTNKVQHRQMPVIIQFDIGQSQKLGMISERRKDRYLP